MDRRRIHLVLDGTEGKDRDGQGLSLCGVPLRSKEKVNLNDPSHIVAITHDEFYKLPYEDGKTKYRYVVTALDRLHNESKSVSKKIKL